MHMQCNALLHVISCHMYNECYTDNSNHTIHHVSWTIILIAYNFHTITHSMSIYLYTHISTSYHTTTTKHVIQNQATTPLILEAKCDIYDAHKTVHKMALRQAICDAPIFGVPLTNRQPAEVFTLGHFAPKSWHRTGTNYSWTPSYSAPP